MEMKDCKIKESSPEVQMTSEPKSTKQEDRYPEISFGSDANYGTIPLDLEDVEAGDKVVIKLIAKVKRKTEEETSTEKDGKKESCRGDLQILEAGFTPYDVTEMRKKPIGKIKSEIDETLND